jgi:hypothetical protein
MFAASSLVAVFATLMTLHGILFVSVGDDIESPNEFSPVAFALLGVAVTAASAAAAIAWKPAAAPGSDDANPNLSRCLLLVALSLMAVSVWWIPSSPLRNSPGLLQGFLGLMAAGFVVDALPLASASLVINVFIITPLALTFVPRHQGSVRGMSVGVAQMIVTWFAVAVFVWYLQREAFLQFAVKFVAEQRAAGSAVQLTRLRALVQGMIPPHAIARAAEDSGMEMLRQRVMTMPGERQVSAAAVAIPSISLNAAEANQHSGVDHHDERADDEQQFRELQRIMATDLGADVVVDDYNACVMLHVIFPCNADDDPLSSAWGPVCAALDSANAAFAGDLARAVSSASSDQTDCGRVAARGTAPQDPPPNDGAAASIAFPALPVPGASSIPDANTIANRRSGGQHYAVRPIPHADDTAYAHRALMSPPVAEATDEHPPEQTSDDDADPLLAMAAREGMRHPVPLRILEQRGDSIVVGGPLIRAGSFLRADGTAATRHAMPHAVKAAVLFMREVADTVAGVAFGATIGDAAAAVLGRGTLRYGVYGVLKHHAADLAKAAAAAAGVRTDRVSVAALSQSFAAVLGGSASASADEPAQAVTDFLAALTQDRHPWALRSLGRYRPFIWARHSGMAPAASE